MNSFLWLLGGLALLIVGGELLVRGAVRLAERMGISPLVIGLTLVGFGTSTPELVTSVNASLAGSPGIAIGNIVGSNIANILLILGVAAVISPVAVTPMALRRDASLVIATAVLLAALSAQTVLSRPIGVLFVVLLIAYIVYAYRSETNAAAVASDGHTAAFEKAACTEGTVAHQGQVAGRSAVVDVALSLGIAIGGLAIVILGGNLLVNAAIAIARGYGISETVIGLTIVAVGTSMPELVTSFVAAAKKQSDVALGNVLGSNIYNILGIGGITALLAPVSVPPEMVRFDNLVMIAVSALLFLFMATGARIGRREGAALAACYVAYVWWIWPT